ncbi:hypothetical protein B5F79_09825 [Olsenella sp. An285]|uniref:polysaccharide pyruvyl transferase family protein n=1 Tax=Olsenella sp. An285 TaxID=1965621 RepID=UPI000B39D530|nr:polysaccharide pyruvyl transferase family protein [Olsenella sp. An285]OUO45394.1 hypothetical protein B5F79_09825 [Olsenella sp. An285]
MRRVGILTYHACNNYGASLQAFALQVMVNRLLGTGGTCKIIDYRSEVMMNIVTPFAKHIDHPKELIKTISRIPYRKPLTRRDELFVSFGQEVLDTTERCLTSRDVENEVRQFDTVICGSDQTWNLDSGIRYQSPVYYLNFPKRERRIAYATSFSDWVVEAEKQKDYLYPMISTFDALSMRETSGVDLLRSWGFECEHVCDPTLLLGKDDYARIANRDVVPDKPYVLYFAWSGTKDSIEAAKAAEKTFGIPVINIVPPPRAMFSGIRRRLDVGPKEFLGLVESARFVVTNSFHGTVFSAIFGKPFVSITSDPGETRRTSLLKSLGLVDRLRSAEDLNFTELGEFDPSTSRRAISAQREHALEYLKGALAV